MPSSFSPSLRIELIAPGEQAGTWGSTTNTNLGTLVEDAIAGFETVSVTTANQALTYADGAADQARNAVLNLTTTTGANFAVYAPPDPKQYTIKNASSFAATIYNSTADGNTTAAGTGVTVPAGRTTAVWSDGTNFAVQNDLLIGNVVGNVTGQLNGTITSGTTGVTQTFGTNNTTVATTAFVQAALQALHPVGSIYINATNSTNPGTLLGFGTWSAFGAGRVPVGFNAADPLFDTAEETGGSKDATVVSHTHTGTTGGQSANHTHTGTTASAGDHAHRVGISMSSVGAETAQFSSYTGQTSGATRYLGGGGTTDGSGFNSGVNTQTVGAHDHTFTTGTVSSDHNHSFTTASAGSSGTNANLQPYITVYMWKRTA